MLAADEVAVVIHLHGGKIPYPAAVKVTGKTSLSFSWKEKLSSCRLTLPGSTRLVNDRGLVTQAIPELCLRINLEGVLFCFVLSSFKNIYVLSIKGN